MNFLRLHPFMSAAALLAAVLIVIIGFETQWGTRVRPSVPAVAAKPAAPVDARVLPTVASTVAEQAYPESVGRPLFVPSRRPAPAAAPVAVATMPKGTLTLQGVTIAGNTRIAMLREKQGGKIHRVEQGKVVNGMSVAQVDADRVVLTMGEESETVAMLVSKAGGQPGAVPPPVASAQGPFAPPPAPSAPGAPSASMPQNLLPPRTGAPNPAARAEAGVPPAGSPAAPAAGQPQPSAAPMTPEELLARRRARRNPQ